MKKKMTISVLLLCMLMSLFVGCSKESGTSEDSGKKEKYLIAMDMNMAPFEFKQDGKWVGIDVELLAAIAKVENFDYETKHMNFNGIIPALQANQVDGSIAAMFIKEERKKTLDFSDGYFESGVGAFTKEDNKEINGEDDFNKKVVAVKKGESGAAYAEENKEKYNLEIHYFDDATAVFQEVTNRGADFGLLDYPVVAYRMTLDKNSGFKLLDTLQTADYGFAVKKGENQELLKKFNDGLKKLKENGEYDKIVKKYINVN
ncbi:transporter substrate-binding domain-containing protein [Niallia sp. 03133]|uniref:transporter substrate-binding domain-containing protein n=1 Tax=Niallia sp. 03133 TaxID=3458060 RepID=UPI0040448174